MKYSTEPPPIYERANKLWGVTMEDNVVFTYGDICHCKDGSIPAWLEAHEIVHTKQQGDSPAEWWERYFEDPTFRFGQELEAYKAQYKFILSTVKDRNAQFRWLNKFATDLAGSMYGALVSKTDAMRLIKHG